MESMPLMLAALAFCTWSVYLGGLAAMQATCSDGFNGVPAEAWGDGFAYEAWPCFKLYGYYWFIMAFEIVLIVGVAVLAAGGKLRKFKNSFLGLFSVATLLFIEVCRVWLPQEEHPAFQSGQAEHRQRTIVAGAIMTAVVNGFLVIALGMEAEAAPVPAPSKAADAA